MKLSNYTSQLMFLPSNNFLNFAVPELKNRQNLKGKIIAARSKVKSRSHHDVSLLATRPTAQPDAMSENNIFTVHKGYVVKITQVTYIKAPTMTGCNWQCFFFSSS